MAEKRTIKARDIVNDLRTGMTNVQLMEKYGLSAKGLASIFNKLMDVRAVKYGELAHRMPEADDTVNVDQKRDLPRNYLMFKLPIYQAEDLLEEGYIRDITENGLQVAGITAKKGEVKDLLIQAEEFADVSPFTFEAECRWSVSDSDEDGCVAGFLIRDISEECLEELRKLIRALALGG